MSLNSQILHKSVFNSKLLNDLLASCFFINLDFLLSATALFNKSISLTLLVFATLGFLLFVFFLHFKQYHNVVFYIV